MFLLLNENEGGSVRRQPAPRLMPEERREMSKRIFSKYAPTVEPVKIEPPVFCVSCSQRAVSVKNQVCEPCAEKLQNIEVRFYHIPVSPRFALLGLIVAGFVFFAVMDWLIRTEK